MRCGIDMIEIERIAQGIDRFGDRFLNRFFTRAERTICEDQAHRLAARLAGKEAVGKALGTGIGDVRWHDIEILSDPRGRPILNLGGEAARLAAELELHEWEISLTHTRETAAAVVVAIKG